MAHAVCQCALFGLQWVKTKLKQIKIRLFYIKSGFLAFLERWEDLQYMWKSSGEIADSFKLDTIPYFFSLLLALFCERCVYSVASRARLWIWAPWPCILPLPLTIYVPLDKSLNPCGSQIPPHLQNKDYNSLLCKFVRAKELV